MPRQEGRELRRVVGEVRIVEPPAARSRKLFVAYPYSFPREDYRERFDEVASAFDVEFVFADAQITSKHILEKITDMIVTARFSLFDITTWNPNVALELGIAMGRGRDYYLLFNPSHSGNPGGTGVPADLGGLDRIQYTSYTELEERLTKLLAQEFGVRREERADPVAVYRERVPDIVGRRPGLKVGEIASELGIPVGVAQLVVRQLAGTGVFETTGVKRGTRYYLKDSGPKRPSRKTTSEGGRGATSAD